MSNRGWRHSRRVLERQHSGPTKIEKNSSLNTLLATVNYRGEAERPANKLKTVSW